MTKWLMGIAVVALCVALGWFAGNPSLFAQAKDEVLPDQSAANPPISEATDSVSQNRRLVVPVAIAQRVESVTQSREYTGSLMARRRSDLSFERGGRVTEILVDDGEEVEQGQLLARLDVELAVAQRDAAKASLDQARAVFDELKAGPRKETITAAQARVASLTAVAQQRQSDYQRSQRLSASDAISQEQLETTQFELRSAEATLKEAQAQLAELLAGTRAEQIQAQEAVVAGLEAQLKKLELDIEDGDLRAPFLGRIANRVLDEGNVVSPGAVVLELVEQKSLEARIGIPVNTSSQLVVGETYAMKVFDERFESELFSMLPTLDPLTRTRTAIFRLPEATTSKRQLVPGQIVRLEINEEVQCDGIKLPATALVPGPRGMWNIYIVKLDTSQRSATKVERRTVELLYTLQDSAIVTGTVNDGEAIVVDGTHRIVEGQAVDIQLKTADGQDNQPPK